MNSDKSIRFARSDSTSSEVLTIIKLDDGEALHCEELGRETPFAVEVTSGPEVDADFIGIYDLDGDQITGRAHRSWELADASEVPADVVAAVQSGWATGANLVERMDAP